MKTVITALLIAAASAATSLAANVSNMADLAPFVYPNNYAKTVAKPYFAPDGLSYLKLSADKKQVVRVDLKTGKETETVMDVNNTRETSLTSTITSFAMSPDGSKLLIATDREPIYRRSFWAKYYIYEIRTRLLHPLSEEFDKQRSPIFSPNGRMVAFVAPDNNIYIKKIDFNTESPVTKDGKVDAVINGVPDWVYEEEFTTSCSMAWSPDNTVLCYLKYNEAEVPSYSFPLYEGACNPLTQYALYPGSFTYKYPVAGEKNSVVTLHSFDVDNRKTKNLELAGRDIEYVPRIDFGGDDSNRLMVVTLNRDQNRMEIFATNPRSGISKSILTEQSDAWIPTETYEDITYGATDFVVLSARTGFTHAYAYSYAGQLLRTITSGNYDVKTYYGTDAKGNTYVQTNATGPVNKVVTRIDAKGRSKDLTPAEGTASAWFDPSMANYAVTYSSSTQPPVVTLYSAPADKKLRELANNNDLAAKYASAPKAEFIKLTTDDGVTLNGYMIKPSDFNASRKYPMIIQQYSGPGSQEVLNAWKVDWTQYAAQQGYVVMCVDTRGTGGRGREWETIVYKNLGHYETIDLQGAARWAAKLPYIDGKRIGITGWSYGGYQTLMAVTTGNSPFAAAVAVAPVTNWRYYDSIYAERYMLTPQQNSLGYDESAPTSHVANLSIPLLIMHGTADDNVHLFNTMQYVSELQAKGKFCDMFLYPNMNHSIYGCDSRLNVYSKLLDYFNKNL